MRRTDPFFPIGVWYAGPLVRRQLYAIKGLGFNSLFVSADSRQSVAAQADGTGLAIVSQFDARGELQVDPAASPADMRLWGWAAILRGAQAISYSPWQALMDDTGAPTPRGKAAGGFAGVVTRNPALFAPLRPRLLSQTAAAVPDIRMSGAAGEAEAGSLESRDALVLVALNHAAVPQRLTLTFAPGTKQEFWQNMESGEMVSFEMQGDSPSLTHAFAARDALVLMIRKTSPYDRR